MSGNKIYFRGDIGFDDGWGEENLKKRVVKGHDPSASGVGDWTAVCDIYRMWRKLMEVGAAIKKSVLSMFIGGDWEIAEVSPLPTGRVRTGPLSTYYVGRQRDQTRRAEPSFLPPPCQPPGPRTPEQILPARFRMTSALPLSAPPHPSNYLSLPPAIALLCRKTRLRTGALRVADMCLLLECEHQPFSGAPGGSALQSHSTWGLTDHATLTFPQ